MAKRQRSASRKSGLTALSISNPRNRKHLLAIASKMLRKDGFYDRTVYLDSMGIDSSMISDKSGLRPIWHGRA